MMLVLSFFYKPGILPATMGTRMFEASALRTRVSLVKTETARLLSIGLQFLWENLLVISQEYGAAMLSWSEEAIMHRGCWHPPTIVTLSAQEASCSLVASRGWKKP